MATIKIQLFALLFLWSTNAFLAAQFEASTSQEDLLLPQPFGERCAEPEPSYFTNQQSAQLQRLIQRIIDVLSELAVHIDHGNYKIERGPQGVEEVKSWIEKTKQALRTTRSSITPQKEKLYFTLYDLNYFIRYVSDVLQHSFMGFPPLYHPPCSPIAELLLDTDNEMTQLENEFEKAGADSVQLTLSQKFFRLIDSMTDSLKAYLPPLFVAMIPAVLYRVYHNNPARVKEIVDKIKPEQAPLLTWTPAGFLSIAAIAHFSLDIMRFFTETLVTIPHAALKQLGIERRWNNLLEWLNISWLSLQRKIPPPPKYQIIEHPTFDDKTTLGFDKQERQLQALVEYMTDPDKFDAQNKTPQKLLLFLGPINSGKTLIGSALAGTINKNYKLAHKNTRVTFIEVRLADLLEEEGLLEAFKEAKAYQPSILYIDDLHLHEAEKGKSLFRSFQHIKDELKNYPSTHVFIIGATTEPERIDQDLRKLFSQEIEFALPDYKKRYQFFKREIVDKYKLTLEETNIESYTRQTVGLNYGQLDKVIRNALRKISKRTINERIQDQLDLIAHHIIAPCDLPQQDQEKIAAYLAGKVLLYHLLKPSTILEFVTLDKVEQSAHLASYCGKLVEFDPTEAGRPLSINDYQKLAQITLGGHIAEDLLIPNILSAHYPDDEEKAKEYVNLYYNTMKTKCPRLQDSIEASIICDAHNESEQQAKLLLLLKERTRQLLTEHRDTLSIIAKELKEKTRLTAQGVLDTLQATLR